MSTYQEGGVNTIQLGIEVIDENCTGRYHCERVPPDGLGRRCGAMRRAAEADVDVPTAGRTFMTAMAASAFDPPVQPPAIVPSHYGPRLRPVRAKDVPGMVSLPELFEQRVRVVTAL